MKNSSVSFVDSVLTDKEKEIREIMIYKFNVSLKTFLNFRNPEEFRKFAYNSCRQTAIFGAVKMAELYPECEYEVYEGTFEEEHHGKMTTYEHAFIVGTRKDDSRKILIDLSRSLRPLVFQYFDTKDPYSEIKEYNGITLLHSTKLDITNAMSDNIAEYITKMKPKAVMECINSGINAMSLLSEDNLQKMISDAYGLAKSIPLEYQG